MTGSVLSNEISLCMMRWEYFFVPVLTLLKTHCQARCFVLVPPLCREQTEVAGGGRLVNSRLRSGPETASRTEMDGDTSCLPRDASSDKSEQILHSACMNKTCCQGVLHTDSFSVSVGEGGPYKPMGKTLRQTRFSSVGKQSPGAPLPFGPNNCGNPC